MSRKGYIFEKREFKLKDIAVLELIVLSLGTILWSLLRGWGMDAREVLLNPEVTPVWFSTLYGLCLTLTAVLFVIGFIIVVLVFIGLVPWLNKLMGVKTSINCKMLVVAVKHKTRFVSEVVRESIFVDLFSWFTCMFFCSVVILPNSIPVFLVCLILSATFINKLILGTLFPRKVWSKWFYRVDWRTKELVEVLLKNTEDGINYIG